MHLECTNRPKPVQTPLKPAKVLVALKQAFFLPTPKIQLHDALRCLYPTCFGLCPIYFSHMGHVYPVAGHRLESAGFRNTPLAPLIPLRHSFLKKNIFFRKAKNNQNENYPTIRIYLGQMGYKIRKRRINNACPITFDFRFYMGHDSLLMGQAPFFFTKGGNKHLIFAQL